MKKLALSLATVAGLAVALAACSPDPTANDKQRDQQTRITSEAANEVGMPNIAHFREMRLYKLIYEMRDQDNLASWSYLFNEFTGKYVPFCQSVGFPIPYATQYSAPESMQTYNVPGTNGSGRAYGTTRLPQSEPNGLNMPASADGTWVVCIGPDKKPYPTYSEPKVVTFLYPLSDDKIQK